MGQHLLPGNPPVELTLRRSPRARRISLRVSGLDGLVTLTLPRGVSEGEALDFARSKGDWLRAQLQERPAIMPVAWGVEIPVEGQLLRIVEGKGRRVLPAGDSLLVPGPEQNVASRLQAFLKTLARDRLAVASDHYAAALGRGYTRITLRDTRSRWGSCTAAGGLMYSWRLILAPPEVLDYVAAHEVAHLQEMNHSAAFWGLVEDLLPDYAEPRHWLRRNGADLHRYRFGD
ncbi:M48 family metallopeptidase [uncultured Roseovarius sp.]|uniref:M48 family metallopeptidase n=1 Tax=uncultured Roseovarius sp. TaxID=293344 RepID=UPI002608C610|nr:SprT family zinc-dependent metalloprotease [uncultured Roseovarius sp.]